MSSKVSAKNLKHELPQRQFSYQFYHCEGGEKESIDKGTNENKPKVEKEASSITSRDLVIIESKDEDIAETKNEIIAESKAIAGEKRKVMEDAADVPLFSRRQKGNYVITGFKPGLFARVIPYSGHEGHVRLLIDCENDMSTWVEIILDKNDIRGFKRMVNDTFEEDIINELRVKLGKLKKEVDYWRHRENENFGST